MLAKTEAAAAAAATAAAKAAADAAANPPPPPPPAAAVPIPGATASSVRSSSFQPSTLVLHTPPPRAPQTVRTEAIQQQQAVKPVLQSQPSNAVKLVAEPFSNSQRSAIPMSAGPAQPPLPPPPPQPQSQLQPPTSAAASLPLTPTPATMASAAASAVINPTQPPQAQRPTLPPLNFASAQPTQPAFPMQPPLLPPPSMQQLGGQPLQQPMMMPPQGYPPRPVFQPMMVMMYAPPGSTGYPPPFPMPPGAGPGQQQQQQPWQPYPPPPFPGMMPPPQQNPLQQQQQQLQQQQRQVTFNRQASALAVPHNPALDSRRPGSLQTQDSFYSAAAASSAATPAAIAAAAAARRSDNEDDDDDEAGPFSPSAAARRGSSTLSPRRVAGGGVMVVKTVDPSQLPSLPDSAKSGRRPTLFLSEVELIGQRRRERDRTMFLLWLLASFLLLTLCFHIHRSSFDRVAWPRFASACLGLGVVGGLGLLMAVAAIFFSSGRHLRDPTTALLVLHSFMAWLAAFVMYLPILVKYVPMADSTTTLALSSSSSSSSEAILAALVLHAISLGLFYPLFVAIVAGGGDRGGGVGGGGGGGGSAAERSELHGALEALSSSQRDHHALHEAFENLQKRLAAAQEDSRVAASTHKREMVSAQQRVQDAAEEVQQLQSILDGLEGSKALDSRGASMASETLVHVRRNHAFEIQKLLQEADARAKVGLAMGRELDLAKTELASERAKAQALRAELDIINLQMSNAGLEQSRVLDLSARLDDLTREHREQSAALSRAQAQLLIAKAGQCIHCSEWRERYELLRGSQVDAAKLQADKDVLLMQLQDLRQQLAEALREQRQAINRTRNKVDRINADLEEFETFTQHMEPEHEQFK